MVDSPPERQPPDLDADHLPRALTPGASTLAAVGRERDLDEQTLIDSIRRVQAYWAKQSGGLWEIATIHAVTHEAVYASVPVERWRELGDEVSLRPYEWLAVKDVHAALIETMVTEHELPDNGRRENDDIGPVVLATIHPPNAPAETAHGGVSLAAIDIGVTDEDVTDATWTVTFGHPSVEYAFHATATASVPGDVGRLTVDREYFGQPRTMIAETETDPTHLRVETAGHLQEADTPLPTALSSVELAAPPRDLDRALGAIVVEHHITTFVPTYERAKAEVPRCARCEAHPIPAAGVVVREVPASSEVLCSSCYAERLAAKTLLSEREADAFALRYCGQSYTAIAEHLDISRSTVRTYLTRSKQKYQQAYRTTTFMEDAFDTPANDGPETASDSDIHSRTRSDAGSNSDPTQSADQTD